MQHARGGLSKIPREMGPSCLGEEIKEAGRRKGGGIDTAKAGMQPLRACRRRSACHGRVYTSLESRWSCLAYWLHLDIVFHPNLVHTLNLGTEYWAKHKLNRLSGVKERSQYPAKAVKCIYIGKLPHGRLGQRFLKYAGPKLNNISLIRALHYPAPTRRIPRHQRRKTNSEVMGAARFGRERESY